MTSLSDGICLATSHGKGVVDGIGGTVKRAVWRHIRSERSHITTPQVYSALAKQLCPSTQVEFVAKSEIYQQSAFLDAKWEGVMAVPQTQEFTVFKLLVRMRSK